ncbi:MAG: flavin reductase family protein [Bacteroidota bacterium]
MKEQISHSIKAQFDLEGINWVIEEKEVAAQAEWTNIEVPFEKVVAAAVQSLLYQMESSESPKDILSLTKDLDLEDRALMEKELKLALQKGSIYLFPSNYEEIIGQHQLPFSVEDLPRKVKQNWMFGFITPELPNWYFIVFVNRNDLQDTYNTGFKKEGTKDHTTMETYDLTQLSTGDIYHLMTGAIAPRPIAFASTLSAAGVPNIAPYSYFNAFSSNPPILVFSSNIQAGDPSKKDTLRNVESTREVVINMVNYQIVRQMAITNVSFPAGVNEFEKSGLTPIPSEVVKPFRIKESPVQMECKVQQIIPLGTESGAGNLILCEIIRMHVDKTVLDERGRINPHRLDLMGRLGSAYYVRASGESIHTIFQPKNKICIGYEQLPENARRSHILTGNDLGQLAGLLEPPSEEAIQNMASKTYVKDIVKGARAIDNLHRRAKKLLASEKTKEAAALVWLAAEM